MSMIPYFPAGFGLVRFKFTQAGTPRVMGCSMGFEVDAGTQDTFAETASAVFEDDIIQNGARLANSWTYIGTSFEYNDLEEANHLYEYNTSVVGTQGSPALPPNVSMLVAKRTGLIGRHYRGRLFVPAGVLIESEVNDSGVIASGVMAGLVLQYNSWFDLHAGSNSPMYLFHQYGTYVNSEGLTVTVDPIEPTILTALSPQSLVATQRRRLR